MFKTADEFCLIMVVPAVLEEVEEEEEEEEGKREETLVISRFSLFVVLGGLGSTGVTFWLAAALTQVVAGPPPVVTLLELLKLNRVPTSTELGG